MRSCIFTLQRYCAFSICEIVRENCSTSYARQIFYDFAFSPRRCVIVYPQRENPLKRKYTLFKRAQKKSTQLRCSPLLLSALPLPFCVFSLNDLQMFRAMPFISQTPKPCKPVLFVILQPFFVCHYPIYSKLAVMRAQDVLPLIFRF